MGMQVDIYGTLTVIPDLPEGTYVEDWGFADNPKEQYWRRAELPDIFDHVTFDSNKVAQLTEEQEKYANEEVRRCKHGFYFYNNGQLTYITGKHYFYLQWWFLEDEIYPDYRDSDRRYFLFLSHYEKRLWCLGVARGKKRREGASSQACSNIMYELIFYRNSNCGIVSKTEDDSSATFTEMVKHGHEHLPVFLKPRQTNREGSVTKIEFGYMNSKVTYKAPVPNAYDRGRMSRILGDEGGKWPLDVPFSKFIQIVSKTLVKGVTRVGFMECPSTVNEMTKGGGAEFKKFWDAANQFNTHGKKTVNRFVTYFTPAYENLPGFIDRYGMSVIDAPTEEQYAYLVEKFVKYDEITGEVTSEVDPDDIRKGAKAYIMGRREGLQGTELEEEIRMNPCTVREMFEAANVGCAFNSYKLNQRKQAMEQHPLSYRRMIFYRDDNSEVNIRDINTDEQSFHWRFTYFLTKDKANKHLYEMGLKKPDNVRDGGITVDSYSNTQGGRKFGSKASAWIGRRYDPLDPYNSGRVIGHLYGRPPEKDMLHQQVMLAAEYFGYEVWYEHTADDYYSYFRDRGKVKYLGLYPISLIDPTKRENAERHRGTPISPFSLTKQLDNGISYVENHSDRIDFPELIDNLLIFDPYDRTKYDMVVSWLQNISILGELPPAPPPPRRQPLIPVYENGRLVSSAA